MVDTAAMKKASYRSNVEKVVIVDIMEKVTIAQQR